METQTAERYQIWKSSEVLGPDRVVRVTPSILLAKYDKFVLETMNGLEQFYILDTKN